MARKKTTADAPQTEAAVRLPSREVVLALFKQSVATKEKTASIAGEFGERVRNQVENGHLDASAFSKASAIYRKCMSNELKGLATLDQLRFLLDIIEEVVRENGHAGNLDDMAKDKPSASEAVAGMGSIDPTGTGALTGSEALRRLRETQHLAPQTSGSTEPPAADPVPPAAPTEMVDDTIQGPSLRVVGGRAPADSKSVKAAKQVQAESMTA